MNDLLGAAQAMPGIDLSHLLHSPLGLLVVALAAIVIARMLFRIAFKVLLVFALLGAGAVVTGTAQLPAGLEQTLSSGIHAAIQQGADLVAGIVHTGRQL